MLDIYLTMKKQAPLDQILKALGDPVRLSAVQQLLKQGEKACGTFEHGLTKATFSHHISILEEVGIIGRRFEGTRKFLFVSDQFKKEFPHLLRMISAN